MNIYIYTLHYKNASFPLRTHSKEHKESGTKTQQQNEYKLCKQANIFRKVQQNQKR